MNTAILFRKNSSNIDEYEILKNISGTKVYEYRSHIPKYTKVIGRYSVLPFYRELEIDLMENCSFLINYYQQHKFIADFEYYHHIQEFTPKTYFNLYDIKKEGKFVVKGKTNSKKLQWKQSMFAHSREDAINKGLDLLNDSLICNQGIIVRDYIPLKHIDMGLNGLPISNEWRFFFLGNTCLTYHYYWSNFTNKVGTIDENGINFAQKIANIISNNVNFFVIDIAETESGEWIVIEVNDGQMSGIGAEVDLVAFYTKLLDLAEKY